MVRKILTNKKYIFIISIFVLILVIGVTYALINWQSEDYRIAISSTCMDITYSKGQDIDAHLAAINEDSFIDRTNNTITVNSNMVFSNINISLSEQCTDVDGFATIELNITNLSNQLKIGGIFSGSIKYVLVEYDPNDYNTLDMNELNGQTFNIVEKNTVLKSGNNDIYSTTISAGDELNYLIFFYADTRLLSNGVAAEGLTFGGSIGARVEQFLGTSISDFTYKLVNNNIVLNKYNGNSKIVYIPSEYAINGKYYKTIIGDTYVFEQNNYIEEVYFSDNVGGTVANRLFFDCDSLKKVVNLPNSITSLKSAFESCDKLENAPVMPTSVIDMEETFSNCNNLVEAPVIPNSVTNMFQTFYKCTKLAEAPAIPNSVTNMNQTFLGCTSMTGIPSIGNSVTNMVATFFDCTSLVNVPPIPNSVTSMSQAFSGCTSLVTAPTLGNSVANIKEIFNNCTSLVNAPSIPDSVTNMTNAFSGCTSLVTAPTLGNSVADMQHAFSGCTSLVTAPTIPNSVADMQYAFSGCTSLVTAPTIPNSVSNMQYAFSGCTSLVNVPALPNSVTNMNSTFSECTSLVTAPEIPSSVTTMRSTFLGCTNLTGTIRFNNADMISISSAYNHPFYNTSKPITAEVPSGSTTYTNLNNNKPGNVTIVTY